MLARQGNIPLHVRTAELQWQLARLRASAGKEEFGNAKKKLQALLHVTVDDAKDDVRWEARDLVARAKGLKKSLESLEFDDRSSLRWS